MAKAISYRRVSLVRQISGEGLGRQDDAAREYCDRTGDQLDETFVDAGMSAYRGKNAAIGRLGRIMELAEAGTWDRGTKLLVEHFDRLGRDKITEARHRAERILKAGLIIVTLADGQEYTWDRINDDLGAIVLMTVMMFKSHEESKLKGDRVAKTKAIRRAAARKGEVKLTRQTPHWIGIRGDGKSFVFFLKTKPAEAIRQMCEDAIAGMGKRLITTRLNASKVQPPKGNNGWHHSTVGALLRDRRLIGEFQPMMVSDDGNRVPNGDPIRDYYPAVISKEVFLRVQAAIRDRRYEERGKGSGGRKGLGYANLFLGLGVCSECGASLVYESGGGRKKNRRILVCGAAIRNHGGCSNRKHHFYPSVESEFVQALTLFDYLRLLPTAKDNHDRGVELTAEIADRVETQRALINTFTSRMPGTVLERVSELETEIEALRAELRAHNDNLGVVEALRTGDRYAEFVRLVEGMNTDMSDDERFALRTKLAQEFRRIIDVIIADPEGITVRLKPAPHQRIEFRFADHQIRSMTLWSRENTHPDWPNNEMRPLLKLSRDQLFGGELIGMFEQFAAAA